MKKAIWIIFVLHFIFAEEKSDIRRLIQDLSSEKWHVQYNAARTLGYLNVSKKEVVVSLTKMLEHENQYIRYAATVALGQIGEKAQHALGKVIQMIESDKCGYIQEAAIETTAKIGKKTVIPILEDRIFNSRYSADEIAVRELYNMCLEAKYSKSDIVRELKAYFIRKQTKQATPQNMIAGLFVLLDKSEIHSGYRIPEGEFESISQVTGRLLDKIAVGVLPGIIASLQQLQEKDIVVLAMKMLVNLRFWATVSDKSKIRDILYSLKENNYYKMTAINAIVKFGMASKKIKSFLFQELESQVRDRRYLTQEILKDLQPNANDIPHLIRILQGKKEIETSETKRVAMQLLAKLGPKARRAIHHLIPIIIHEDSWNQNSAIEALSKINPQMLANILVHIIFKDDSPRHDIAREIGRLGNDFALRSLIRKNNDGIMGSALAEVEPVDLSIISTVNDSLKIKYDPEVPWMVTSPLIKLKNKAVHAVPSLIELLNNKNRTIRNNAVDALAHLGGEKYSSVNEQWDYNLINAVEKALKKALQSDNKYTKFYAAYTLAKLDNDEYLSTMIGDIFVNHSSEIAQDATRIFRFKNPNYVSNTMVQQLVNNFGYTNEQSQYDIVSLLRVREKLVNIRFTKFTPALTAVIKQTTDRDLILEMLRLLYKIGHKDHGIPSMVPELLDLTQKYIYLDSEIPIEAVRALTYMEHNPLSIATLRNMLKNSILMIEAAKVLEKIDLQNLILDCVDIINQNHQAKNFLIELAKKHPWLVLHQLLPQKYKSKITSVVEVARQQIKYSIPYCCDNAEKEIKNISHAQNKLFTEEHFGLNSSLKAIDKIYGDEDILEGISYLANETAKKIAFSAAIRKNNEELFAIFITAAEVSNRKYYALKILAKLKLKPAIMIPAMQKLINKRYLYLGDGYEVDRMWAIKILSQFSAYTRRNVPALKDIAINCYSNKAKLIDTSCGTVAIQAHSNTGWYQDVRKEAILALNKINYIEIEMILEDLQKDPNLDMRKFAKDILMKRK
ncbi:HEAT repeat domain-containing protein [Candidatus Uabimicrobium sp. HlEnr_7]|uniref:HEAT repeat domain-containing protein n=1 Tax=Candidatus Uabimicrobium helgolandensis TaxID=3095367 RepID=UPI003556D357